MSLKYRLRYFLSLPQRQFYRLSIRKLILIKLKYFYSSNKYIIIGIANKTSIYRYRDALLLIIGLY